MEFWIVIGIIWGIVWLIGVISRARSKRSSGQSTPTAIQHSTISGAAHTKQDPHVYRPSKHKYGTAGHRIVFTKNVTTKATPTDQEIKDLVDALTGAPLQLTLGLYQCQRCKVFYQAHSFDVIQSENGGRCVSCLHTEIVSVTGQREQRGQNARVKLITLNNYLQHVGHVITFEGKVHTVLISRRGTDYAVMFENKTWTRGFKMVVFRGDVERIGGPNFLFSLTGHQVSVRGLLVHHERFGYEIIVSDRGMILEIR